MMTLQMLAERELNSEQSLMYSACSGSLDSGLLNLLNQ